MRRYSQLRGFTGEYFLCLYDGWREYTEPFANPIFVPWREVDAARYTGVGAAGEPRFLHRRSDGIFPVLPLSALIFCRHVGDENALLIPDADCLDSQYKEFSDQVGVHDREWNSKKGDTLFWRGRPRVSVLKSMHPREVITSCRSEVLDACYSTNTPLAEQLQHKYLLDVDGMVSAWSGLFWKLRSNSVPVKIRSYWEQWYYLLLHYGENVVFTDLKLEDTYQKLAQDDALACAIGLNGKNLAERLTYEFACEEYVIA